MTGNIAHSLIIRGVQPQTGVLKVKIRLNPEAVEQLIAIMDKTGYVNPTHTMQVMISSTFNKLIKNANKNVNNPKSLSEDIHGNQSSKTVRNM